MGIGKEEMSGHGFRAMARTILDEVLGFRPDFIEHQLAHAVRDPNGRAYNRTAHLPERERAVLPVDNGRLNGDLIIRIIRAGEEPHLFPIIQPLSIGQRFRDVPLHCIQRNC